jgi:hypoxanthine phosphoribosyltransferase
MNTIQILDKKFSLSIPSAEIQLKTDEIARNINSDLKGRKIVFIVVLNGAFMFASDLYKQIKLESCISFLKLASYSGTSSNGKVKQLIGLNESLKNKTVVLVEDIIDTGHTLDAIINQLKQHGPAEIKIASLLHKPDAYQYHYKIDYLGFNIPNRFIVGYGLDYEGFGRNLNSIYTLIDN